MTVCMLDTLPHLGPPMKTEVGKPSSELCGICPRRSVMVSPFLQAWEDCHPRNIRKQENHSSALWPCNLCKFWPSRLVVLNYGKKNDAVVKYCQCKACMKRACTATGRPQNNIYSSASQACATYPGAHNQGHKLTKRRLVHVTYKLREGTLAMECTTRTSTFVYVCHVRLF